jgi:DNA invertase Pin-like site-specific DNA recombinase/5-methylcytosine-specific restriction endonuclease McrA
MNEERDRQMRLLLEQGVSKVRIAEELGINRETVSRVAARLGYPSRKRSPDTHDWAAIRSFYKAGNSAAATQRRFGFSESTWTAAIARGEITPRPRGYPEKPKGETRAAVERLHAAGFGVAEIAKRLGVSKPTVCYHLRKLGVPAQQTFARRHDWEAIQQAYDTGMSMRQCKKLFGFSPQAWYDAVSRGDIVPRDQRIPLEEFLVVGRRTSRGHLKARLLEAGLKESRCEICGITHWMGKPVNMQLHHKNGDGSDNRIDNLQLLCGTCHSQTDTYGGRNGHRRSKRHLRLVEPPPDDDDREAREDAA